MLRFVRSKLFSIHARISGNSLIEELLRHCIYWKFVKSAILCWIPFKCSKFWSPNDSWTQYPRHAIHRFHNRKSLWPQSKRNPKPIRYAISLEKKSSTPRLCLCENRSFLKFSRCGRLSTYSQPSFLECNSPSEKRVECIVVSPFRECLPWWASAFKARSSPWYSLRRGVRGRSL